MIALRPTVAFPRSSSWSAGPAAVSPEAPLPWPLASPTILLVEDEDSLRRLAADFARSFGFEVLEAPGSDPALRLSAEHPGPIHLLVTDVSMPGRSGPELADEICRQRPETCVLFMTGDSQAPGLEERIRRLGGALLPKPFTLQALTRALRGALPGPNDMALASGETQ